MARLSLVIPAYNEQDNIENTHRELQKTMQKHSIDFEMVFIDDGSSDQTWVRIERLSTASDHVNGIKFSRNFGKEAAIYAGLAHATGECCVVMDCDLQHPPETVVKMYELWRQNDVHVIEGVKSERQKESLAYRIFAKFFYKLLKISANIDLSGMSDFKLLDRQAVDVLLQMPERQTFFRAMSGWIGFQTLHVEYDVGTRVHGETKWSKGSLWRFALNNISSFSSLPMQIVTACGIVFFLFGLVVGAHTLIKWFGGRSLEGFTTVILLLLIIGSVIMFSLGVIGFYISKIYEEVKHRPRYIIEKKRIKS